LACIQYCMHFFHSICNKSFLLYIRFPLLSLCCIISSFPLLHLLSVFFMLLYFLIICMIFPFLYFLTFLEIFLFKSLTYCWLLFLSLFIILLSSIACLLVDFLILLSSWIAFCDNIIALPLRYSVYSVYDL